MWMGRDRAEKVEGQAVYNASEAVWSQPHVVSGRLTSGPPPRAEQPVMALHTWALPWAAAATAQRGVPLDYVPTSRPQHPDQGSCIPARTPRRKQAS